MLAVRLYGCASRIGLGPLATLSSHLLLLVVKGAVLAAPFSLACRQHSIR